MIVRLSGGIGNQLFIWNYATYLCNQLYDYKTYYDRTIYSNRYFFFKRSRSLELNRKYDIKLYLDQVFKIHYIPNLFAKILYRIAKINSKKFKFSYLPFIVNDQNYLQSNLFKSNRIIFLSGVFSDSKLFNDSLDVDLNIKFSKNLIEILNKINKYNSISIHIRGAQYIELSENVSTIPALTKKYYYTAIETIYKLVDNPIFFVFSNDVKYAKSILKDMNDIIFIERNVGSDLEQFAIMSKCKHNIISNSTFSWWAAVINKNKNKIIIAPRDWAKKSYFKYQTAQELPLQDWIVLPN